MNNEEQASIHDVVSQFISRNKDRYEIITVLQNNLYRLTEESYSKTLQLINDNKSIFFEDHSSTIFFFCIIIRSSRFNFKNFELNLNVIINFSKEIRSFHTTEFELISISSSYYNSLNYLFSKNFFTIESIVKHSFCDTFIFINFLPEIASFDSDYANTRKRNILKNVTQSKLSSSYVRDPYINTEYLEEYLKAVETNPEKHIENRNLNYHPSVLHKSIRDDDIDTFQSYLYKNNINVNHKIKNSYYERAKTIDDDMSLIQIAAIYGSVKIFKFLWQNEKIVIDDNLLCYAYCGYNFDIIHLCETGNSFESVYLQPIALHQNDLLDYFIENYSDKIIENDKTIQKALENFNEDENNLYQTFLNNSSIEMAFYSMNYNVILQCLEKIIYIARNVKNIENPKTQMSYIIFVDFELFQFIYSQRYSYIDKFKCGSYYNILLDCINECKNDVFKFVFNDLKEEIPFIIIFRKCLQYNHDMANYILDLQFEEIKLDVKSRFIYNKLSNNININDFRRAVLYYNEEIVVKMIKLYQTLFEKHIADFIDFVLDFLSKKMIDSLMEKIESFLSRNSLNLIKDFLKY